MSGRASTTTRDELIEARDKIARQIETLKHPTATFYGTMDLKPDNRRLIADLQTALDEIDAELGEPDSGDAH